MISTIPQNISEKIGEFQASQFLTNNLNNLYLLVANKPDAITKDELLEAINKIYEIFDDVEGALTKFQTNKLENKEKDYYKLLSDAIYSIIDCIEKKHLTALFTEFDNIDDNNKSLFLGYLGDKATKYFCDYINFLKEAKPLPQIDKDILQRLSFLKPQYNNSTRESCNVITSSYLIARDSMEKISETVISIKSAMSYLKDYDYRHFIRTAFNWKACIYSRITKLTDVDVSDILDISTKLKISLDMQTRFQMVIGNPQSIKKIAEYHDKFKKEKSFDEMLCDEVNKVNRDIRDTNVKIPLKVAIICELNRNKEKLLDSKDQLIEYCPNFFKEYVQEYLKEKNNVKNPVSQTTESNSSFTDYVKIHQEEKINQI